LTFLDQTEQRPEVKSISLLMAAAVLTGTIAVDADDFLMMSQRWRKLFATLARECFASRDDVADHLSMN
jgi:hypothetical protein